ncbi:MAG: CPBP family intramembrane glutamic endopeptidase [Chitinophagales bacterium]
MRNISVILILGSAYLALVLMSLVISKLKPGIVHYDKMQPNNLGPLNYLHIAGILVMFFPSMFLGQQPVFLLSFPEKINIPQAAAFLIVFGAIGFFPWKKFNENFRENKNAASLATYKVISYACFRSAFLIVYEWFFRGLLLISLCDLFGVGFGISINVLLYALLHMSKSKKEIIGCIPLGILLCVFTIWWQSIWPAIIFHIQIGIINEWPALQQFISPQKQTAL